MGPTSKGREGRGGRQGSGKGGERGGGKGGEGKSKGEKEGRGGDSLLVLLILATALTG